MDAEEELELAPDPGNQKLTRRIEGIDHDRATVTTSVTVERPLTLFLNSREIVTMMTISDYPEYLAVGYLVNQNMILPEDDVVDIEYDDDLEVVVVRTRIETDFEEKLQKKTLTSGCAQGTVFGDLMESFEDVHFDEAIELRTTDLYSLLKKINTAPSLYLEAGAIHGCVLCSGNRPLIYMEDVGRHNAVDKIAGYMYLNKISSDDKIFYTTGRLTSEMVIKTVQMGVPILISRSGFTAWGVDLARQANLTLIGRARGKRFLALSGTQRIVYDHDLSTEADGLKNFQKKGA